MTVVTVADYGMGNLLSVTRAFEYCGAAVKVSALAEDIASAESLVLPGVGAFPDGMRELRQRGLKDAIKEFCRSGRPFLGICLGMQLMLDSSEEFGETQGLGLIPGKVSLIPSITSDGIPQKIPHIGWNLLRFPTGRRSWAGTILESAHPDRDTAYFVHSYTAVPANDANRLADTFYGGHRVSAAIHSGNCYGTQFHPEKSGPVGLEIIKRFLALPKVFIEGGKSHAE